MRYGAFSSLQFDKENTDFIIKYNFSEQRLFTRMVNDAIKHFRGTAFEKWKKEVGYVDKR